MKTDTKTSLSEQIRKIPAATRPMVEAAIKTVKEAAPKAADEITYRMQQPPAGSRMMWKIVRYAVEGENVVGVGTFSRHASIFFYRGRELDDGSGLLQGSGKDSRFITLRSSADSEQPIVKQLVRKAFKLARTSHA
jgi:hypothetical protein